MIITCHWCGKPPIKPGKNGVGLIYDFGAQHWFCTSRCCENWLIGYRELAIKLSESPTEMPILIMPSEAATEMPQRLLSEAGTELPLRKSSILSEAGTELPNTTDGIFALK